MTTKSKACRKIVLIAFWGLLFLGFSLQHAIPAFAQFTTVTGCITETNGLAYSFGTVSAVLTPATPGGYRLLGQFYSGQLPITTTDQNGCFTANMGDNGVITPAASQWTFTIGTAGMRPPLGKGPQSFSVTMTITGASQTITATLSAAAPALINALPAGAASSVIGPVTDKGGQVFNALGYPGASIVEKTQAAVTAAGAIGGGTVYIPPGNYTASAVSTWPAGQGAVTKAGVTVPSKTTIQCGGIGSTVISYTRSNTDPVAVLFQNSTIGTGNSEIRITGCEIHVTLTTTTNNSTYDAPIDLEICDLCEIDHNLISGNSNRQIQLLDMTRGNIHDNWFLVASSTVGGVSYGNSAIGINRSGPAAPYDVLAAQIHSNGFIETGIDNTGSLLVITASGLDVYNNVFDLYHYTANVLAQSGNAIEAGIDGSTLEFGLNDSIHDNQFNGGSAVFPVAFVSAKLNNNKFFHSGIAVTAAGGSVLLTNYAFNISDNELRYGSINVSAATGDTGYRHIVVANNKIWDGTIVVQGPTSQTVYDTEVLNNTVWDAPINGIQCTRCSVVSGNRVIDTGQTLYSSVSNSAIAFSQTSVKEISNNTMVEDQNTYSTGTVCSISFPPSTTCLLTGTSDWVFVTGGTWSASWTNRTLYLAGGNQLIEGFSGTTYLQLANPVLIASGTTYNLSRTTYTGMQLNASTIDVLADNHFLNGGGGWNFNAMTSGGATVAKYFGNYATSGGCSGCALDYFKDLTKGIDGPLGTIAPNTGVLTTTTSGTYLTTTNCKGNGTAANPSVVTCGSASAGMFSCDPAASTGTCRVNTTAATANSEIGVTQNQADGGAGQLNLTCNTGNVLPAASPLLQAKGAGFFIINLGTVTVNAGCFEYQINN
jgi:hypothetical protein